MTVFADACFLLLRHPAGGVEDLAAMQAAGFQGVFCNVGDHDKGAWEAVVRPRALQLGMFCGPWLRTQGSDGDFAEGRLYDLVAVADVWSSPLVVNSESELKGSGAELTELIANTLEGRDAALSMEAWPFADVEWWPLADVPVLPQLFPPDGAPSHAADVVPQWHAYGVKCVFPTFATYGGMRPADYQLVAPYSLYTGDDMGGDYAAWRPTAHGYQGCFDTGDEDMELIGSQHGIDAAVDRLIKLDPEGSKPNRNPDDLATWGAYDKLRRTLTILAEDHDQQAVKEV
jgi:hypothetical protein